MWEVGGVGVMLKELCGKLVEVIAVSNRVMLNELCGKLVEVIAVSNRVMLKELCGKLVVWELC